VYLGSLCAALLVAVGFGPWQTKQKPKTPAPQTETTAQTEPVEVGQTGPDFQFPNPWPAPLARPDGSVDDVAATLARKVLAGGPDALPALERAALESGFAIHDENGKELYKPDDSRSVGVSMLDLDLATAAELTKRKNKTTVAQLQQQISENPDLNGISLSDLFSTTVSDFEGADDERPSMRFWGQFVQALGWESNREFRDPALGSDRDELCGAQVTWLLYMASAQAAAATRGANVQQAPQETPAENPPTAQDPPPHGPSIARQGLPNDAITNLNLVTQLSAQPNYQQAFQDIQKKGFSPELGFIELCRQQMISLGLYFDFNPPKQLVRTKTYGQTGGSSTLRVRLTLRVDKDMRRRYNEAVAVFPKAQPLPADGPVHGARFTITPPDECDVDSTSSVSHDIETFTLTAKKQMRHLVSNPKPDDYQRTIYINADSSLMSCHASVPLDIRDWQPTGMKIRVIGRLAGYGDINDGGGSKRHWEMFRSLFGIINLTTAIPAPSIHTSTDVTRYTTWMQYPQNPENQPNPWSYSVNDAYKSEGPVGGCGSKPGATMTQTEEDKDRRASADEEKALLFNTGVGELDQKAKTLAITFPLPGALPVTVKGRGPDTIAFLQDVTLTNTAPHEITQGDAKFMDISTGTTGGFQLDKDYVFDGKYMLAPKGKDKVEVEIDVTVTFSPPPGSTPAQMADAVQQAKAATRDWLASLLQPPPRNSSSHFDEPLQEGHGPLWISDASAATCWEVQLADELPASMIASKR